MENVQPKLRFSEFDGNWEEKKLGEISKFSKGKGISKADIIENGKFECIRYGQLYTHYGETIKEIISTTNIDENNLIFSEFNDIIIPASGETQLDIATASCVLKERVALGGDLNIIKTDENGVFLSYYLNNRKKEDIASLAQGVSVVHLYSSQLATLSLNLPNLSEQTKIANFLTSIDEKINLLKEKATALAEYKKGMMQKIFNQELRFKDEFGKDFEDWEEKSLGECLEYEQPTKYLVDSTDYNDKYETPVLTAGKTFILGYTNETIGIYKIEELPVIIFDDFTTATQFVDFPFKAKSSAMKILKAKKDIDVKFVYEIMQNLKFEVGGHGRHWISIYSNLYINLPSLKEQTKIATFLSAIDEKIDLVKTQIEESQEYKKGLLQQMFV